ncbi:hypothetical protein FHY52_04095 [Nocardia nova]|uniref:hypothetical protein n=1 Tax=Nocardia nova TaxID=37330 RepID=UPI0025B1CB5B|nr:hypothetical protein [Nocardia nova]MDN2495883.1 hypothetical protein [Nocardia nova]
MKKNTNPIPADIEMDVVRLIYAEGGEDARSGLEKTRLYQAWTGDPRIGGRLMPFLMTDDNVRVWIKNGPMKELTRARFGVGKYRELVRKPAPSVEVLVRKALGETGWSVSSDTLETKPLRVVIHRDDDEEEERWFGWGKDTDFKHLAWRAIQVQANGDNRPWVICTVESRGVSVARDSNERIAKRLGLTLAHVTDGW